MKKKTGNTFSVCLFSTKPACSQKNFHGRLLSIRVFSADGNYKGSVIRATFFFNLSCNIVTKQVKTLCCAYCHLRGQLVSQQNTLLQVEATCCEKLTRVLLSATNFSFVARITTEVSTCLATDLTSTLVIGCQRSAATLIFFDITAAIHDTSLDHFQLSH